MNVAIKLPDKFEEKIGLFPFIHAVNDYFMRYLNEDEIFNLHLISLKNEIEVLNLLPFKAYYHELDREDLKNVFNAHRACAQFKIEGLNYFFSTTESFVDASLGRHLGAKVNIGFSLLWNNLFLNTKVVMNLALRYTDKALPLLEGIMKDEEVLPRIRSVFSRELESLKMRFSPRSYCVVDLTAKAGTIDPVWLEVFDLIQGANFVLMCTELSSIQAEIELKEFIKSLSSKNQFDLFSDHSHINFAKLVSSSYGLISRWNHYALNAYYCGVKLLLMENSVNDELIKYFIGSLDILVPPGTQPKSEKFFTAVFDKMIEFVGQQSNIEDYD